MKGPAIGSWDQVFGAAAPGIAELAGQARALILSLDPQAVEVARPGDRAVSYGLGPAKMRESYAYLMPQARWLNLGFYHGAVLHDPAGLLQGSGKGLRHIKLHAPADLGAEVAALLRAARAHQAGLLAAGALHPGRGPR